MRESRILQIWRILYPPLMYFIISYIVQLIGILILIRIQHTTDWNLTNPEELQAYVIQIYNQNAMLLTMISACITIPICLLLYQKDRNRHSYLESVSKQISLQQWAFIALFGMAASVSLNDWIALSGIVFIFDGFEQVAEALYGGNLFIEFLAIVIAAPLVEELLFRGIVYKRIREIAGVRMAILLSALYFGVYHMNVVQGIYAFLLGILLAWIGEKYQSLGAPILFHAAANFLSVVCTEWEFSYRMTVVGVLLEILISTSLMIYAIVRIHRTA